MASPESPPDLATLLGPKAQRSHDMEAAWAWTVAQDVGLPNWLDLEPAEARRLVNGTTARWNTELPAVAAVEDVTVPGGPAVACRLITPLDAEPGCLLFLHGGGWSFGTPDTYARFTRLLSVATRRRVLVPDYRLAPENPYPAPFDDCWSTWRWLADNRQDLAGSGPLAIAGDSAGANLALAVIVEALETSSACPEAALLFYGAFAAGTDSPSYERFAEGYGLTRAAMGRFWDFYAPPGTAARRDPRVSPVTMHEAALTRLPHLFLNAAGLDPLLCDTLDFADRLRSADVEHTLVVHEGVHHGFMQMSQRLPEAERAIETAARFWRDRS